MAEPRGTADHEFERVDFTYWPKSGRVEFHGHTDLAGESPLLGVSTALARKAVAAFGTEIKNRVARAAAFDRSRRVGCS